MPGIKSKRREDAEVWVWVWGAAGTLAVDPEFDEL